MDKHGPSTSAPHAKPHIIAPAVAVSLTVTSSGGTARERQTASVSELDPAFTLNSLTGPLTRPMTGPCKLCCCYTLGTWLKREPCSLEPLQSSTSSTEAMLYFPSLSTKALVHCPSSTPYSTCHPTRKQSIPKSANSLYQGLACRQEQMHRV